MARVPEIWKTASTADDRQFNANFTILFEDQYAARHLRASEFTFRKYLGAIGALVLLMGLVVAYQQWKAGEHLFAVGAILLVLPASYLLARLTFGFVKGVEQGFWRGFYERRGMINRPIALHMNAGGYSMDAVSHKINSGWDKVLAVEEDAERYFLFYEQDYVYIVPKRAFEGNDLQAVDEALRDWCSGKFRQTRRD